MAPTIESLHLTDEPEAWRDAGFTVDADSTCALGLVRIVLGASADAGGPGISGWVLRDALAASFEGGSLDGLPTAASTAPPPDPGAHPNHAARLDHLVLTSGDGERTQAAFEAAGWELRRVRDVPGGRAPTQQRFFRAGEVILELVAPTEPTPRDRERPAAFYGLALVSADLDATVAFYADTCNAPKEAVQPGRRIATLRTRELGIGIPIAFMTP